MTLYIPLQMSAIFKLFHFYAQVAVAAILSLISGNGIAHSLFTAVNILKPDPPSYYSLSSTLCGFGSSRKTIKDCTIQANKTHSCQLNTSMLLKIHQFYYQTFSNWKTDMVSFFPYFKPLVLVFFMN